MSTKRLYRKPCDSLFEAEEIAANIAATGNIDAPGPGKAWAGESDGAFFAYVELAGNAAFDALAATEGWERVG